MHERLSWGSYAVPKPIAPKKAVVMQAYPLNENGHAYARAYQQLNSVVSQLQSASGRLLDHAQAEEVITREGREILRALLQGFVDQRSTAEPSYGSVVGADQVERGRQRRRSVGLASVFGLVTVLRTVYEARGHRSLMPLDAALNLPAESYSFGLRRLVALEGVRGSYDDVVAALERSTGTRVPKRQAEQLMERAAQDFEAFYEPAARVQREQAAEEGLLQASIEDLLVLTVDGKGIVMRHDSLREATQKAACLTEHKLRTRLSRGEKNGRKRMATVAAVYDVAPYVRAPADVLQSLGPPRDEPRPKRPKPRDKRVWARIDKAARDVIDDVFAEALARDPQQKRHWVVLVDGANAQLRDIQRAAKQRKLQVTIIVDFVHVLEYLWRAAWSFHEEGESAAETWVAERAFTILQGRASDVAAGIRRSATLRKLSADKRKGADDCADYLLAKKRFLRYHDALEQGLPIATGVIEGACRYLVKDRMDITGARWSLRGAEAVLRLRALVASGHFDDYWDFHLEQELCRNHSSRYDGEALPIAA